MTELGDLLGQSVNKGEDIQRQLAKNPDVATHLQFFTEEIVTYYSGTKIESRGLGSSFIVGDSTYGKLGTQTPQPYLGTAGAGTFATKINTSQGSPFLNDGRTQLRDFVLGSSAAAAPTTLLFGSGTQTWAATQSGLQYQHGTATATRAGEGNQYGSFYATVSFASSTGGGSYTEIAISGGKVFTRDTFTQQIITAGSELRISAVFRVGS